MPGKLNKAATNSIAINIFLFIIKVAAGFISNSIAIISEAVNSLTDIVSSAAIRYALYVSKKKPDKDHQFGHGAAQPLASFVVAVFAFVLGIKIVEEAAKRIIEPQEVNANIVVYTILFITIISKIALSRYQFNIGKKFASTALKAAGVDSLNDVLSSSIALCGLFFSGMGLYYIDGITGIIVAAFIFKTGYEIAKQNLDYLMGRAADEKLILEIANRALKVNGVKGFNDLRSHYVGDKFHVEIHIEVDKNSITKVSHDIGKEVQFEIEKIKEIQKVFVHIDPV